MFSKEVTLKSKVSKESVWNLYSDVENWNKWDSSIEYSKLYGKFKEKGLGLIKSKGGPENPYVISELKPFEKYTITSKLPLARLNFIHELLESEDGLIIMHRVFIEGPLSSVFGFLLGEKIIKHLPETLKNLEKTAGGIVNA